MACLLGAGIGALVALQMGRFFWWTGALVGGLTGYLAYDFKEVPMAVSRAWRLASGWRLSERQKQGWMIVFAMLFSILSWGGAVLLLLWLTSLKSGFLIGDVFGGILAGFLIWMLVNVIVTEDVDDKDLLRWFLRNTNPITICFWRFPRGCWYAAKWLVMIALPIVGRFFKELFLLVHSDIRLLCGLDATLGAALGYFAGNAFIGAIAGGLLGVVNFELLSKRVLKVLPIKTN